MQKKILDLVNDFSQWRGNSFTLAILTFELTKEEILKSLEDYPEAAEIVRDL